MSVRLGEPSLLNLRLRSSLQVSLGKHLINSEFPDTSTSVQGRQTLMILTPAPAPATQLPSRRQAVAATAPSPRITRSRSGKLPPGNTPGGRAGASASSSEPKTRRGGMRRTAVGTSAAPSRPTRDTRGGAEQSTENGGVGHRTRRK